MNYPYILAQVTRPGESHNSRAMVAHATPTTPQHMQRHCQGFLEWHASHELATFFVSTYGDRPCCYAEHGGLAYIWVRSDSPRATSRLRPRRRH